MPKLGKSKRLYILQTRDSEDGSRADFGVVARIEVYAKKNLPERI